MGVSTERLGLVLLTRSGHSVIVIAAARVGGIGSAVATTIDGLRSTRTFPDGVIEAWYVPRKEWQ